MKDLFSKCDQITQETAHLVTFTKEILNRKLDFLCSVKSVNYSQNNSSSLPLYFAGK